MDPLSPAVGYAGAVHLGAGVAALVIYGFLYGFQAFGAPLYLAPDEEIGILYLTTSSISLNGGIVAMIVGFTRVQRPDAQQQVTGGSEVDDDLALPVLRWRF